MPDKVNYRRFVKGVDNRRSDQDMLEGSLRLGRNIDVLNSGLARRRRGIAQAIASSGSHSLFSDDTRMVWATATTLELANVNLRRTTVLTSPRLAKPLSWLALHGELYFSNEDINGKINAANQFEQWGITPPAAAPMLTAPPGNRIVQVTCTFVAASGEESGAPLGAAVFCTDAPVIQVTGIPQSADARVVATRLYVTDLDGTEFFQQVDVRAGVTACVLRAPLCLGQQLVTQFMQPPPPGQAIDYENGRILIAVGRFLVHTQGLRYGLYDPTIDYLQFADRINMLKTHEDGGAFVGVADTRFVNGFGTETPENRAVLPYRAIEGSAIKLPNSKDVMWLSERGFIRGSADGAVRNLTEGQVAMTRYERAAMGLFEYDGHKAVIAITKGGTPSQQVAKDYIAADAARRADAE